MPFLPLCPSKARLSFRSSTAPASSKKPSLVINLWETFLTHNFPALLARSTLYFTVLQLPHLYSFFFWVICKPNQDVPASSLACQMVTARVLEGAV